MRLTRLIHQEALHRKLTFLLGVFSVAAAVAGLVGGVAHLRLFDLQTEALVAEKEAALQREMEAMEDEYRKITKRMGFNVLILPKDQDLADFYAENYAQKTMPESYARTLADARNIVTIRHLLPMLQQKVDWPEKKRKILLSGVRGEMAWAHRKNMKPILKPVPPGSAAVGYELHRSLGLKVGDSIDLMGKAFRVSLLHPERGTIDDITVWMDLAEAQQLLEKPGEINSMMALECKCAWADLPKVRREIQAVLPQTQVIELAGKALARAEARYEAEKRKRAVMAREEASREELYQQRQRMLATAIPLVIAGCAVWIGVLAFSNVRERQVEIGVLRALGVSSRGIFVVILTKALLIGMAGSVLGAVIALAVASQMQGALDYPILELVAKELLLLALVGAPVVTMASSWLPALLAAGQDPAVILREE